MPAKATTASEADPQAGSIDETVAGSITAIVTGGSRGIGAGVARALGAAGANLVLGYRSSADEAEILAAEFPGRALAVRADLGLRDSGEILAAAASSNFGGLDVLVVNAGIWRGGRISEIDIDDLDEVLDTNLSGAIRTVRSCLPLLRGSPNGRIIVVSSSIALMGYPGDVVYASSKMGLIGLVRSLAKEIGAEGITVNAVAPGLVDTDMTAAIPQKSRDQLIDRTPLGRMGRVEEVADAVRFLALDASYITGHVLVVDGGMSL